jgi:CheY-like chemotaxis protein
MVTFRWLARRVQVGFPGVGKMAKSPSKPKPSSKLEALSAQVLQTSDAAMRALKALALFLVIIWVACNHNFVKDWLWTFNRFEGFGIKLEREVKDATAKVRLLAVKRAQENNTGAQINNTERGFTVNVPFAAAAIRRAALVAPAIVDARILWVDDVTSNVQTEIDILRTLRITVVTVQSTADAVAELQRNQYDLVISDVWRPNEKERVPLDRCRVRYFEFPDSDIRRKYSEKNDAAALEAFNRDENLRGPHGFGMAEQIDRLNIDVPIIFYAGRSAQIARSLCGDTITNRADVLLQRIVSLLEERRWELLPR